MCDNDGRSMVVSRHAALNRWIFMRLLYRFGIFLDQVRYKRSPIVKTGVNLSVYLSITELSVPHEQRQLDN